MPGRADAQGRVRDRLEQFAPLATFEDVIIREIDREGQGIAPPTWRAAGPLSRPTRCVILKIKWRRFLNAMWRSLPKQPCRSFWRSSAQGWRRSARYSTSAYGTWRTLGRWNGNDGS